MKIIGVSEDNEKETVEAAAWALKRGDVVVCPTDTVYGLLADAANEEAVRRVFRIKGRAKGKALPVFVKDVAMAKRFARIDRKQERFLRKNWPGKVTAVLESRHKLPKELEQDGSIALRIPNYELVNRILAKLKRPLTGTSANISGASSCSSGAEVIAQFQKRKHQPDLVLDAGKLPKSKPSTVVDITSTRYKVVRK